MEISSKVRVQCFPEQPDVSRGAVRYVSVVTSAPDRYDPALGPMQKLIGKRLKRNMWQLLIRQIERVAVIPSSTASADRAVWY